MDLTNTQNGRYGFLAKTDAGDFCELERLWDDIPKDAKISELQLWDAVDHTTVLSLTGGSRYFFYNEAVSGQAFGAQLVYTPYDKAVLTAKVFGFIVGNKVVEVRVDMFGDTAGNIKGVQKEYPVEQLALAPHAFRAGVTNG